MDLGREGLRGTDQSTFMVGRDVVEEVVDGVGGLACECVEDQYHGWSPCVVCGVSPT